MGFQLLGDMTSSAPAAASGSAPTVSVAVQKVVMTSSKSSGRYSN